MRDAAQESPWIKKKEINIDHPIDFMRLSDISSKLKDGRNLNPKSRLKRRQLKRPKRDLIPIKDDQIIPEIKW